MRSLHPWFIFPPNLELPSARSLSLLFILQELASSFYLIEYLKKTTPEQLQGANLQKELETISSQLEKFLLFSLDNPFTQKRGVLDKLCFYSDILIQASKVSLEILPMILEDMRASILRIKSKLLVWKKALHPLDEVFIHLFDFYNELDQKFSAFFSALIPYLKESRTNENILFYLIENKEIFNRHLQPQSIENLLNNFFPAGFHELRAAICEGFTRRGFSDFFAKKEDLINAVEWDSLPDKKTE